MRLCYLGLSLKFVVNAHEQEVILRRKPFLINWSNSLIRFSKKLKPYFYVCLPFTIPSLTQALALQFGQVVIDEPPVGEKEGVAHDIYTKRTMPNYDKEGSQQRNVKKLP